MTKTYKVDAIKNGTVIDHIPEEKGILIAELLCLKSWQYPVTIGVSFTSQNQGKKDIIKIENRELTEEEVNKIALIAPQATINIIRNYQVAKKFQVELPDILDNIIKCSNPDCVTNHEPISCSRFFLEENRRNQLFRCAYCERYFTREDLEIV